MMKRLIFSLLVVAALIAVIGCTPETEAPIRDSNNKFVTLETSLGNLTLELYHDVAPAHADSFYARATEGFYDSTIFHRIIKGFMIQGGDPQGTGMGNAGYFLNAEFSDLPHVEGTLSAARSPRGPNTASCQFFICLGDAPHLNNQYTVFGHLVNGYEVLRNLGNVPVIASATGEPSQPKERVTLIKAYASDAEGKPLN